jgi:hypothetical protein
VGKHSFRPDDRPSVRDERLAALATLKQAQNLRVGQALEDLRRDLEELVEANPADESDTRFRDRLSQVVEIQTLLN